MKRILLLTAVLIGSLSANLRAQGYTPSPDNLEARQAFSENRFGIFLHWGIYSLFGQGEWYMTTAGIDHREYAKAAQAFYPHRFDARAWVAAFKAAGARYICFTTRHHDGFSMWDSQASDYNIMHTPYGRDILRQLADECHRQGIRLHLYYSHLDWTREDYPIGQTGRHTGRTGSADWASYYAFMNRQLTELLTNYGRVDAIWFDGMWDHRDDNPPFDWQLEEQYALIHRLQPACLIGNNHHLAPIPGEDIQLFERDVPGENKAGYSGQAIGELPLETCQTMNGMWGYKVTDQNYKSTTELIRLLVRTAAKGANLLLNVGPQPDGSLPDAALERLQEMGRWLAANGEAIYGTTAGGANAGDSIVTTRKGDHIYVHLLQDNIKEVCLPLNARVKRAEDFTTHSRLPFEQRDGVLRFTVDRPGDTADHIVKLTLR